MVRGAELPVYTEVYRTALDTLRRLELESDRYEQL
jgi:hypothetical protein